MYAKMIIVSEEMNPVSADSANNADMAIIITLNAMNPYFTILPGSLMPQCLNLNANIGNSATRR